MTILGLLVILLAPLAFVAPDYAIPGEAQARALLTALFRPWSFWVQGTHGGLVHAADGSLRAGAARADPRDAALVARLFESLDRAARPAQLPSQLVTVLRCEGRRRRPTRLLLETQVDLQTATKLAGAAVVHGEDLLGFVMRPETSAALGPAFDGKLRVALVDDIPGRHRRRRGRRAEPRPRWAAIARSSKQAGAPVLRMLVEAAHDKDPFPLRVLRSVPRHLETWAEAVAPYIARTARSERLHPGLPAGLVLGTIEDLGYRDRAFVLQRFIKPRWDPRSLVRVAILKGPWPGLHWAVPARLPHRRVRVLWQSPAQLAWRRKLLRGAGLRVGAAVIDGLRCLGRVEWAAQGAGGAVPLCSPGSSLPLIVLTADAQSQALVVVGRGLVHADTDAGPPAKMGLRGRFQIRQPKGFDAQRLEGAWVFTGVVGRRFPYGLLCGRVRRARAAQLDIELFGLQAWPEEVEIAAQEETPQ